MSNTRTPETGHSSAQGAAGAPENFSFAAGSELVISPARLWRVLEATTFRTREVDGEIETYQVIGWDRRFGS